MFAVSGLEKSQKEPRLAANRSYSGQMLGCASSPSQDANVANETLGWDPTCHNPGGHCHWEGGEHKKFSPFCLIIL